VEAQLRVRTSDPERISEGIRRFIIGFSKKILIANQMAVIWEEISGYVSTDETPGPALLWIGALAFTFQIYFDFSGYSDMAIGLGKIFGFDYLENFNYPYISSSITEFWRRWHMSLSSWFKEYVYIPLGGNRKGLPRQLVNIAIVWALTGLWHGASWNFVLWGVYYGVLLIAEKLFLLNILEKIPSKLGFIRHIYTMFFVIVGWVIFNITDFSVLGRYIALMFGAGQSSAELTMYYVKSAAILMAVAVAASLPIAGYISKKMDKNLMFYTTKDMAETFALLILLLMSIAFLVSGSYNPFLYFRF
jgi:alginate O-acetyltransferase complex protein AlgI